MVWMVLTIFVTLITISYWGYRLLKKTMLRKIAILFPAIIFGTIAIILYLAVNPTNEFYIEQFEKNSEIKFPISGRIIEKDATFPDLHGDYWAAAIIEVEKSEFEILKTKFKKSTLFIIDTTNQKIGVTKEYDQLTNGIQMNEIEIVYANNREEWFKVAFLNDSKRLIFERASS